MSACAASSTAFAQSEPVVLQTLVAGSSVVQPTVIVTPVVQQQQRAPRPVRLRWGPTWYAGTVLRTVYGPYSLVRFDGYGPEWDSVVHERDLREPGQEVAVWQPEVPGTTLPSSHVLRAREPLLGEWHGSWYPVTVQRVTASGEARIRYDGFGSEWDETLVRARLRLRGEDGVEPDSLSESAGEIVQSARSLFVGQRVIARAGPAWRTAFVRSFDGPVVWVHYRGMARAYDEPVTVDRLRVPFRAAATPR